MGVGKKAKENPPPFETQELRGALRKFFSEEYVDSISSKARAIGSFKWGVYIFYDYDGEPIYVGQTKEKISGRIGRHLTNQRTDAVAMSVLDPFEVCEIEVYPLPEYQEVNARHPLYLKAKTHLDALEYLVHEKAKKESKCQAILNEKDPPPPLEKGELPKPHVRGSSDAPDFSILPFSDRNGDKTSVRRAFMHDFSVWIRDSNVAAGVGMKNNLLHSFRDIEKGGSHQAAGTIGFTGFEPLRDG